MADKLIANVIPNIKAIDLFLPDGSHAYAVGLFGAIPSGANVIGGVNPPFIERVSHPWGKGACVPTGVVYGTELVTSTDAYEDVEVAQTIAQPAGYTLVEAEFGLTLAVRSSGAVEAVNYQWLISDAGALWSNLVAATVVAAPGVVSIDQTNSGRWLPGGNALLTGTSFQVKAQIQSGGAGGETAKGKIKNSSYVLLRYRRT